MINKNLINWLEGWLSRKPETATSLKVSVKQIGSREVVLNLAAQELTDKKDRLSLATAIHDDCNQWADNAQKETTFYIQWFEGDSLLATQHFKVCPLNEGVGGVAIDGSPESIITLLQHANLEKEKNIINILKAVSEMVVQQTEVVQATIEHRSHLERENLKLKELLIEKGPDDDAEWKKEVITVIKGFLPAVIPKSPS